MDLARIRSDDGLQPKPTSTFLKITKFSQLSSTFLNFSQRMDLARIQSDDGLPSPEGENSHRRNSLSFLQWGIHFCNGKSIFAVGNPFLQWGLRRWILLGSSLMMDCLSPSPDCSQTPPKKWNVHGWIMLGFSVMMDCLSPLPDCSQTPPQLMVKAHI